MILCIVTSLRLSPIGNNKWSPSSTVAVLLKISKVVFKSFKEIETKIIDVDNVEMYKPAKSQFKFCCILGYRNITNLTKFQTLKMCIVQYLDKHIFLFLLSLKYDEFGIYFLHTSIYIYI
jgi:hypothetical protein